MSGWLTGSTVGKAEQPGEGKAAREREICTPNYPCLWKRCVLSVVCALHSVFTWAITLNKAEKHGFSSGNKSTGNPWFSAHEKVLFFKHTDVFK